VGQPSLTRDGAAAQTWTAADRCRAGIPRAPGHRGGSGVRIKANR